MTLANMVRLAENCRNQGNEQGARIVEAAISQELKIRNQKDSGILDRVLVDVRRMK